MHASNDSLGDGWVAKVEVEGYLDQYFRVRVCAWPRECGEGRVVLEQGRGTWWGARSLLRLDWLMLRRSFSISRAIRCRFFSSSLPRILLISAVVSRIMFLVIVS